MTLIIALKCKDGIVMASDGQATVGSSAGFVRQRIQKIFPINPTTLFSASGSVGTIQKARDIIRSLSSELEGELNYKSMNQVRSQLFEIYKSEIDRHKEFYKGTDHQDIKNAPISDVLICSFTDKQTLIWHIAPDCADERLDPLGFGCTGSGDGFAYTLLNNLYKTTLSIEKGKLVAFRVIKDAIEVGAYGLGYPIDIWTLSSKDDEIKANRVEEEEKRALWDSDRTWREAEKEVFKNIYETGDED